MGTKVVYLLGVNGSGKEYITDRLTEHRLIQIDDFRHRVLGEIERLLNVGERNKWDIWRALTPRFDVAPEIAKHLKDDLSNHPVGLPIVVEGGLLAYSGFFTAFNAAIETCLDSGIEAKRVWINPPAEQVHVNKTKHRGREDERDASLDEVRESVVWYRHEMKGQKVDDEFDDADLAINNINRFLLRPISSQNRE